MEVVDILRLATQFSILKHDEATCRQCHLCGTHVLFDGNNMAKVAIVGEGPGNTEVRLRKPFVGPAGQFLNDILSKLRIERNSLFITNVMKCQPPGNRTPESDEIAICKPWLVRELQLLKPQVIICLGAVAASALIHSNFRITRERGNVYTFDNIPVIPTFHPAYILRQQEPIRTRATDMFVQDMQLAFSYVDRDKEMIYDGQIRGVS